MDNRLLVFATGSSGHRFSIFSKVDAELLGWTGWEQAVSGQLG
jgi:hypothetical protein